MKGFPQGKVLPEGHFTAAQLLSVMNGSYRQLDYWTRTKLIGETEPTGSGYWRTFSRAEALRALQVDALIKAGVTLARIRQIDPDVIEVIKGPITITIDDKQLESILDSIPPSKEAESHE